MGRSSRRLQVELVALQEWIVHEGLQVVVLFEGRDTAGKGGVIRRITERTNPRVRPHRRPRRCRATARKPQWYFQRYVAQLPAAGEMVLFDRSWYNRAGVERVMGFCTERRVRGVHAHLPRSSSGSSSARASILVKYWLSVTDEEQERRFKARLEDPEQALEAEPDRHRGPRPLGRLRRGQGRDVRLHRHQGLALVRGRGRRQAHRPAQPDLATCSNRSPTSGSTTRRSSSRRARSAPTCARRSTPRPSSRSASGSSERGLPQPTGPKY